MGDWLDQCVELMPWPVSDVRQGTVNAVGLLLLLGISLFLVIWFRRGFFARLRWWHPLYALSCFILFIQCVPQYRYFDSNYNIEPLMPQWYIPGICLSLMLGVVIASPRLATAYVLFTLLLMNGLLGHAGWLTSSIGRVFSFYSGGRWGWSASLQPSGHNQSDVPLPGYNRITIPKFRRVWHSWLTHLYWQDGERVVWVKYDLRLFDSGPTSNETTENNTFLFPINNGTTQY
ncbi:MAG: hypothetical protein ACYDCO_17565 [Armatimonadota bacterium]